MLFKVCSFLYLHTSRETLLPPERQPLVLHKMCLAHAALEQPPGRGTLRPRAGSTSHRSGGTHSPALTAASPPTGAYQMGVSSGRVTELQVAPFWRGAVCQELSFLNVGLHWRRSPSFLPSHPTETGATLVSVPRRKLPGAPQQAVLSTVPLFWDCSEGKVQFLSCIFKCQLSTAAEGS